MTIIGWSFLYNIKEDEYKLEIFNPGLATSREIAKKVSYGKLIDYGPFPIMSDSFTIRIPASEYFKRGFFMIRESYTNCFILEHFEALQPIILMISLPYWLNRKKR